MCPKVLTVVIVVHAESSFCERRIASFPSTLSDWSRESVTRSNSFLPLSDPCRDTTIWLGNNYHLLRGIDEQRFVRFDEPFAIVVRLFLTGDAQRRPWQRVQTFRADLFLTVEAYAICTLVDAA